jgi:hypothetical protein
MGRWPMDAVAASGARVVSARVAREVAASTVRSATVHDQKAITGLGGSTAATR